MGNRGMTRGSKVGNIGNCTTLNVISIYKTHFSSASKDRHTWSTRAQLDAVVARKVRIYHALHHRLLVADWQSSSSCSSSVICQFFFFVAYFVVCEDSLALVGGCYFSLENRKYFTLWWPRPKERAQLSNLPRSNDYVDDDGNDTTITL